MVFSRCFITLVKPFKVGDLRTRNRFFVIGKANLYTLIPVFINKVLPALACSRRSYRFHDANKLFIGWDRQLFGTNTQNLTPAMILMRWN